MVSELVEDNLQNTKTEKKNTQNISDNNTLQTSGQSNRFNSSIQIWDTNTTTLNTIPANTTQESQNTTNSQNTITNQVSVENVPSVPQETTENQEQVPSETPEEPNQETFQPQETEGEELTQPPIQEEDNFRTQGYISVNENTEYYSEEDNFIIGENYEETLKNMTDWIHQINWGTYLASGAKANMTQEELIKEFQSILSNKIQQNNTLILKLYVKEGKTIKISFEFPETAENFDISLLSKSDNEKYLTITHLVGEETSANGNILGLYQKKSDAVIHTRINIQKIVKSKISQKTNLEIETKGTSNAKKYTTNVGIIYSDAKGEFKINLENALHFEKSSEIEELGEENCLFLDQLSNEELVAIIEAVKQKTSEVFREKNRNLNIIDLNNSNLIVQQKQQNQEPQEDMQAKEQAKQILIQTISNQMRQYLDQGKQLTIEDLEGLEIPGYEVQISISSNLAIITVNGYKFKLDSDFNLSD